MHSDHWADVPYEAMPAWKQHEARECQWMDSLYDARDFNTKTAREIGERLFVGQAIGYVPPPRLPYTHESDFETLDLCGDAIRECQAGAEALISLKALSDGVGDGKTAFCFLRDQWRGTFERMDARNKYHQAGLHGKYRQDSPKYKKRVELLKAEVPEAGRFKEMADWAASMA